MRLEEIWIRNFRSCYETRVELSEHLTLLVGENDAGKSNIIDALRASVPPVSGRPLIWFDQDRDRSFEASAGAVIEIGRRYCALTSAEDAFYVPSLVDAHRKLVHTTTYQTAPAVPRRSRISHTVGDHCIPDPEPENRDRIAHVYLRPLRDAAAELDSAAGNRLGDIFRLIASDSEIDDFETKANQTLGELADQEASRRVVSSVQEHLTAVTQPVRHRVVGVRHKTQRLAALVRSLRLHMAAEGLALADLLGSGLGYANLLFIATVVLELERASEYDLLLLLVEEPEAHLHPQLQTVLLAYLEEKARGSTNDPPAGGLPAGRIQVICTTHSPQLTSHLSTSHIVVVRAQERSPTDIPNETGGATSQTPSAPRHVETKARALSAVPLAPPDRRKIDRYLDATRASLLFARQVLLVEGVAEAVLLRTLAECQVFPEAHDAQASTGSQNHQLRNQFRAITIVPIGGVDFLPFLRLLLHDGLALVDRVVVVTDGDKGAGAARKEKIEAEFPEHVATRCLYVAVGGTTLEAELFAAVENEAILREAFRTQHPRSLDKWDELSAGLTDPILRAARFSKALKDKDLDLGKGDFAHVVADLVSSPATPAFTVPSYLLEAIQHVVIEPEQEKESTGATG